MTAMISRRLLLASTGALLVTIGARAQGLKPANAPRLAGSLKDEPRLAAWVQVAPDGAVTVFSGKAELGQGIRTALVQVAAEQLYLTPDRITLVTADTGRTPDEGYTAGSHSMQDSGTAIMNAAAEVRGILVAAAAARLGLPADSLVPGGGRVAAPDGRSLGFGELVSGADAGPAGAARRAAEGPGALHCHGPRRAADRHPCQGHGRRRLCAGPAAAWHAARQDGAAAPLRRRVGEIGTRHRWPPCPAWSRWYATVATSA